MYKFLKDIPDFLSAPLLPLPFKKIYIFKKFSWLYHIACGILVPQPGIRPEPLALEARSLYHWTTREVPHAFPL